MVGGEGAESCPKFNRLIGDGKVNRSCWPTNSFQQTTCHWGVISSLILKPNLEIVSPQQTLNSELKTNEPQLIYTNRVSVEKCSNLSLLSHKKAFTCRYCVTKTVKVGQAQRLKETGSEEYLPLFKHYPVSTPEHIYIDRIVNFAMWKFVR